METHQCPYCGAQHPVDARFCPATGRTLNSNRFCPNCGQTVQADWRACGYCGYVLQGSSVPVLRKFRLPLWGWLAGGAVLVLGMLCAAIYFIAGLGRVYEITRMTPEDTIAVISLSPSIFQLPHLRNYENLTPLALSAALMPEAIPFFADANQQLELDRLDIDVTQDVLPWIGREVSVALLPGPSTISGNSKAAKETAQSDGDPVVVLAAAARSEKAAGEFVAGLRSQIEAQNDRARFRTRSVEGVQVTSLSVGEKDVLAYAVFNRMLVVASGAEGLQQVIDAANGKRGERLADNEAYRRAIARLPGNRLGLIYRSVEFDSSVYVWALGTLTLPMHPQVVENVSVAIKATSDGLEYDYQIGYDPDSLAPEQKAYFQTGQHRFVLPGYMPEDCVAFFAGQDIFAGLEAILAQLNYRSTDYERSLLEMLESQPGAGLYALADLDVVEEFENLTGVNIVDDIFTEMRGEYAWALIGAPGEGFFGDESFPFDVAFYTQVSNAGRVGEDINTVFEAVAWDGDMDFYPDTVSGAEVWLLGDPYSEQVMGYGFHDEVFYYTTSLSGLRSAAQAPRAPLAQNPRYQKTAGRLGTRQTGLAYVDVEELIRLMYRQMSPSDRDYFDASVRGYIADTKAIGINAGELDSDSFLRGKIFVYTGE